MQQDEPQLARCTTANRFRTILADPPWDREQKGARGAQRHYPLMTMEQIKAMPVSDLATEHAHLWLWVTNATLREGYDVAEGWGFTVRSPLTWIKFRLGLGGYLRNSTEHLLFATRGHAPVNFRSQPTWINAPVQEHSRKPDEQYVVIERISDGPYLELFARRPPASSADWSIWGNEINSDIRIPGYPVPSDARFEQTPSWAANRKPDPDGAKLPGRGGTADAHCSRGDHPVRTAARTPSTEAQAARRGRQGPRSRWPH